MSPTSTAKAKPSRQAKPSKPTSVDPNSFDPTSFDPEAPPLKRATVEGTVDIPLEQLEDHPHNRHIADDEPELLELAQAIALAGQLEPLRVRPSDDAGGDRYQIISGHRRKRALAMAKFTTARCEVVDVPDGQALAEVAMANAQRKNLDPFQRAELMQQLMAVPEQGGSGMTASQAGKIFGIQSDSGASNALRLAKLPESLKDLVRSGTLSERCARELLPFVTPPHTEELAKHIAEDLTGRFGSEQLAELIDAVQSRDIPAFVFHAIDQCLRPMDPDEKRHNQWPTAAYPCLFEAEATQKQIEALRIIELPYQDPQPYGSKKANPRIMRRYATNTTLWDKLQKPKIAEAEKARQSGKSGTKKKPSKDSPKLTAAQLKTEEKRKAKEADQRLQKFTLEWRPRLIRCFLAGEDISAEIQLATLPWLLACTQWRSHETLPELVEICVDDTGIQRKKPTRKQRESPGYYRSRSSLMPTIAEYLRRENNGSERSLANEVNCLLWRRILWPVSNRQKLISPAHGSPTCVPSGQLPEKLDAIHSDDLEQLLEICGFSIQDAWNATSIENSTEQELLRIWLGRHTKGQLQQLLEVKPAIPFAPKYKVSELVDMFVRDHTAVDPNRAIRPMPAALR